MVQERIYKAGLDKSSKKHICPGCGRKSFTYYIDKETGGHLPEKYGYCDKLDSCGYNLNPYSDGYYREHFAEKKVFFSPSLPSLASPPQKIHFDYQVLKKTQGNERMENNVFVQNLCRGDYPMNRGEVYRVAQAYGLGTILNGSRAGGCCFPFIDLNDNVRAVQVKQFDSSNHTVSTDFLHSMIKRHSERKGLPIPQWIELYEKQEKKITCLFGEHLLNKYPNNPIALVEAPKTAIIGTLYFGLPDNPDNMLWLAVYNKSSFSRDKLEILRGRNVIVFPDLSATGGTFKEWQNKAVSFGLDFKFSDMLEQGATPEEKAKGLDLADYLVKYDWRLFRREPVPGDSTKDTPVSAVAPVSVTKRHGLDRPPRRHTFNHRPPAEDWTEEIAELRAYFAEIDMRNEIQLNTYSRIVDPKKYVESNLLGAEKYNGKERFRPFLDRLHELKSYLNN